MRGRLTISLALLGALLAWSPQGQAARTVTDFGRPPRSRCPTGSSACSPPGRPPRCCSTCWRRTGWPAGRARRAPRSALHRAGLSRPAGARPADRPRRHRQPRGGAAGQARPDPRLRLGARHLRLARRPRAGADRHPLRPDRRPLRATPPRRCACSATILGVDGARPSSWPAYVESTFAEIDARARRRCRRSSGRGSIWRAARTGSRPALAGSINTEIIERVGGDQRRRRPERRAAWHRQRAARAGVVWNPGRS